MGVHLRKKLRLFYVSFMHNYRAEVRPSAFKRLGIIFVMVAVAVFGTNLVATWLGPYVPLIENIWVETVFTLFVMALLMLILLRKTKSGRDVVLGK